MPTPDEVTAALQRIAKLGAAGRTKDAWEDIYNASRAAWERDKRTVADDYPRLLAENAQLRADIGGGETAIRQLENAVEGLEAALADAANHYRDLRGSVACLLDTLDTLQAVPVKSDRDFSKVNHHLRALVLTHLPTREAREQAKADMDTVPSEWRRLHDRTAESEMRGQEIDKLRSAVDKLQAFKAFVHGYLDTHGVPHHPPGPHGAEGCRIGDRLDWLMAERDRLWAAADDSRAFVRYALEFFGWAAFPHLRESVEQLRDKLDAAACDGNNYPATF